MFWHAEVLLDEGAVGEEVKRWEVLWDAGALLFAEVEVEEVKD